MADDKNKAASDFLDQSEIDKLLNQATEAAAPKQVFIRADGTLVDGEQGPKVEA